MSAIEEEPTPIMEVLRGATLTVRPDRLSVRHIELRDQALRMLERAKEAVAELADLERGERSNSDSPRFRNVKEIEGDVGKLIATLDRTYV